jgi:hypothetical protein
LVARLPFHAGDADFDQFVIVQRPGSLGYHRVARASLADEDHGFQRVPETSKMSALSLGKFHRGIVAAANGTRCSAAASARSEFQNLFKTSSTRDHKGSRTTAIERAVRRIK